MNKIQISNLLRFFRLLFLSDKLRFIFEKFKNRKINKNFKASFSDIVLPPDYLIYESFQLNYSKYYTESRETANWLVNHFKRFTSTDNKKVLDWGCGPGRIIRHLPDVMGDNCEFYATDYNERSINWCKMNLPGIQFNCNSLEPHLPYQDNFFDIIFGISIITHLSEKLHYDWYHELYRVLKPGGVLLLTSQGKVFKKKLTVSEQKKFGSGKLVVRGKVKEGHRTYSAFQPEAFMRNLFRNAEILNFIQQKEEGKYLHQDVWIVRK